MISILGLNFGVAVTIFWGFSSKSPQLNVPSHHIVPYNKSDTLDQMFVPKSEALIKIMRLLTRIWP